MPENGVLTPPISDIPADHKNIEDEFELDIRVSTYSKTITPNMNTAVGSICHSDCRGTCWNCTNETCNQNTCAASCNGTCSCTCNTFLFICC